MKYLPLLLSLFLFASCGSRVTNKALKTGDKLKSAIEDFEGNRQKLSSKMVTGIEEAEGSLTAEDPDLPEIAKDWEKEWRRITGSYDKMKKDFSDVGERSEAYFNQLDELSGSINNESLKREELAKNTELRAKWELSYDKAAISVAKIEEVMKSGNDFHMVLVASSIRQKIEQNVAELNNIASQAKSILSDLESFTQAGRELVEG